MRIDILCNPDGGHRCVLVLARVREVRHELDVRAEVLLFCDRRKLVEKRV